ncbi:hypothetical protein [Streptomyces europaeiscabiei]|uniref:hypothetical protein n=1 Tax=Streptomyces europaeiscabiei TaxID=146819 RepID=UPI002E17D8D4
MALRNAVMAALLEGEASGCDLAAGIQAGTGTGTTLAVRTPNRLTRKATVPVGRGVLSPTCS